MHLKGRANTFADRSDVQGVRESEEATTVPRLLASRSLVQSCHLQGQGRLQQVHVWGERGFQRIVLDMLNVRSEFRQPNGYGKLATEVNTQVLDGNINLGVVGI